MRFLFNLQWYILNWLFKKKKKSRFTYSYTRLEYTWKKKSFFFLNIKSSRCGFVGLERVVPCSCYIASDPSPILPPPLQHFKSTSLSTGCSLPPTLSWFYAWNVELSLQIFHLHLRMPRVIKYSLEIWRRFSDQNLIGSSLQGLSIYILKTWHKKHLTAASRSHQKSLLPSGHSVRV